MGEHTGILWTDHSFNGWWGCTRVSPGCENCYAETFDKRVGGDHWGPGKMRRVFGEKHWNEPLKWNRKAQADGVIRKMFCFSMADIFDEEAPAGERDRFWELCRATPFLIKQLLTKRVTGYRKYMPHDLVDNPMVWCGFTAEDQRRFDERWPEMVRLAPRIPWVSYEPALGPLTYRGYLNVPRWTVCGGESGNGFRPMHLEWAENLRDECRERGVEFFMKQMSARTPHAREGADSCQPIAAPVPGNLKSLNLEGFDHDALSLGPSKRTGTASGCCCRISSW